jgi:hypothetical protein
MSFRILAFILLAISQLGFAQGRGPAVEDFVGIEVDHPEDTPQGTEGLFNFEKDITKFEKNKSKPLNAGKTQQTSIENQGPGNITTTIAIAFLVGLPLMIWFLIMNHLRSKAAVESASNIEVLEKYRRQREESKKTKEEIRKAS